MERAEKFIKYMERVGFGCPSRHIDFCARSLGNVVSDDRVPYYTHPEAEERVVMSSGEPRPVPLIVPPEEFLAVEETPDSLSYEVDYHRMVAERDTPLEDLDMLFEAFVECMRREVEKMDETVHCFWGADPNHEMVVLTPNQVHVYFVVAFVKHPELIERLSMAPEVTWTGPEWGPRLSRLCSDYAPNAPRTRPK